MDKDARKELGYNNREWGQKAEALAAEYFLKEGYTIRERNWRAGRLEVDLILEKDRTLIFVEVKARSSHGEDPALAVDRKKDNGRYARPTPICGRSRCSTNIGLIS